VLARVDGARVLVSWRPGAGGEADRYRVVRATLRPDAPENGTALGDTTGTDLVDFDPPVAEPVRYSVAARVVGGWSPVVSSEAVTVLPEVRNLRLTADDRSVAASWRPHPRTATVEVHRTEGQPPAGDIAGQPLGEITRTGFRDTAVVAGSTYCYRVAAVYHLPDGSRRVTPGQVASATAEAAPDPVRDLRVTALPDKSPFRLLVTWTEPQHGEVSLHLSDDGPPWRAGEVRPAAEVAGFGRALAGEPERRPGGPAKLTVSGDLIGGRRFLTPVTVRGRRAVLGDSEWLSFVAPVRRLTAERLGATIRLGWAWQGESTSARVRWWRPGAPRDRPLGEATCSLRQYMDDGGFEVEVGPEAVTLTVEAVMDAPTGREPSVPVQVEVEGTGCTVRYSLRRQGRGRRSRRRRLLVLDTDASCILPPLVVVQLRGVVIPLGPEQGEVVLRLHEQPLDPWAPCSVEFDLLPIRPSRLGCFLAAGSAAGITLVPLRADQLKVD